MKDVYKKYLTEFFQQEDIERWYKKNFTADFGDEYQKDMDRIKSVRRDFYDDKMLF